MEVKASKFATEDVISNMPDNIVTYIMDRLPVQDAVKTSILSKNWRFKWTMLSQLVFDYNFFEFLSRKAHEKDFGRFISRLLLHLKGAITKFVLTINDSILDDGDIAHWIWFLSTKGVKDLTLIYLTLPQVKLPTHLFSCLELERLELFNCHFDPPASFHGFPNLLSLELDFLYVEDSKFEEFIIQCPLLEILKMRLYDTVNIDVFSRGQVNLVEIAKLANIRILSLALCNAVMNTNYGSILELVGFLPKLQDLDLDFEGCKFTEGGAKKRTFATFPCLKTLTLSTIDLCNGIMSSFALELIRSSPNLQTLLILPTYSGDDPTPALCSPDVDNNTMELLQLQSVKFTCLKGLENEVYLIKCLLACSPFLKKIVARPHHLLGPDEKFKCASKLLKLPRASPIAEINLS